IMGNAVYVPRNDDRVDKTEDQHDRAWHTGKEIKHAEGVNAVENACRDWNNVPACVRKDSGICLCTLDGDQFTRRSSHCVQERVLEYTIFTDKSTRNSTEFRFTEIGRASCR